MSMPFVKICGLTTAEAVAAVTQAGAHFAGFILYPRSPRHVSPELYGRLADAARLAGLETVLVTVNADDSVLADYTRQHRPDYLQAHGAESPPRCAQLRAMAKTGLIKAFGISCAEDLRGLKAYAEVADILLLDAKPARGELPGGNAKSFDWQILADAILPPRWMLSGGLDAQNVARALSISKAPMLDVSSGVEFPRKSGENAVKDPQEIKEFMHAIRR